MRDLVCLVADKNMAAAVEALLERPEALAIRRLTCEVIVHPRRDPGCFHDPHELLRGFRADTEHAIVLFDRAWDGAPERDSSAIETMVEERLGPSLAGWARAVVIDPELEAWVFSDSPHVATALGWLQRRPNLRNALRDQGLWPDDSAKPPDPRAAVEWVLRAVRKPRSSSIYRQLAQNVSLQRCRDRSFRRLSDLLRSWFGAERVGGA